MFIQMIQGTCRDSDALRGQIERWAAELGPGARGWLGGTYGVTDDNTFVAMVRFDSREAADQNSTRPEQGAWWAETKKFFFGEVTFHDLDNAMTFLDGGTDDAGFVQVIQGQLTDPERFRRLAELPMDLLQQSRPEIIGGVMAMAADGTFIETVAFRSEEAAREGERKEMPAEVRQTWENEMAQMENVTYLDLRHPWFASRE
jgi:hypothetical protein